MKKILFYIPTFPTFTQNFIAREIEALSNTGDFDIYILSLQRGKRGTVPDSLRKKTHYFTKSKMQRSIDFLMYFINNPIKTIKLLDKYLDRLWTLGTAVSMVATVRTIKPDLIFANWITEGALMANILKDLTGIPYGVECHAEDIWLSSPDILRKRILDAAFVLTCTNYNAAYLKKIADKHCSSKINVIYHYATQKLFRDPHKHKGLVPQIYLVGRMVEKKGFIYFIRAAKILKDRGLNFRSIIAGDPSTEKIKLEMECFKLGVTDVVSFSSEIDFNEHSHNYLESDIFVAPSIIGHNGDIDGIPNVIVEAMLAGLPVVASSISAIPEVVTDNETGFLVEQKDERVLADRIEILINDKNLRDYMGESGKRRAEELFGYNNTIAKFRDFLLTI